MRRSALLVLAACSNSGGDRVASQAQIVVMAPNGASGVPGSGMSSDLVVMNLDGTAREQITHDDQLEFLPHFSPDATRVVYTKFERGTYGSTDAITDIALYDFTTRTEVMLTTSGIAAQAAWSPDGTTLAYLEHAVTGASTGASELWEMDADGAHPHRIASAAGGVDDAVWGDPAWSSDDWILFVVQQTPGGCLKVRLDKMRPDGTQRTKVSDGGANCTPPMMEQSGDADPGFSADGRTIYTSRGLPQMPPGAVAAPNAPMLPTERKLVALSSDAWTAGKVETDLSLPAEPDCIEGVPKGSPDGMRVLLFRFCFDAGAGRPGIYVADAAGTSRTYVADGFGPDWNPLGASGQ